jgi:hypothetical protein
VWSVATPVRQNAHTGRMLVWACTFQLRSGGIPLASFFEASLASSPDFLDVSFCLSKNDSSIGDNCRGFRNHLW